VRAQRQHRVLARAPALAIFLGCAFAAIATFGGVATNPELGPEQTIRRAGQRISTEHGEVEIAMLPTLERCVQWVLGSGTQPE
jgi:hypothetical protein